MDENTTLTATYAAARNWLFDCFEDAPADMTNAEAKAGVSRHYEGGWSTFILDQD
jgi:hypothetical protein